MKRVWLKIPLAILSATLFVAIILGIDIASFPRGETPEMADAAIVLGAAIWTDKPSPVFRERLNWAANLYLAGKVKKLIVTGGYGEGEKFSESEIGAKYLAEQGVAPDDVLQENQSRTTLENLKFSFSIVQTNQFSSVLIVSDPLHLRRSLKMAGDLGFNAYPSATPTSRYESFWEKTKLMAREIYFYAHYLILRA